MRPRPHTTMIRPGAFQAFNITAWRSNLVVGENVLAIQGLNRSLTSLDFLCTARLTAIGGGVSIPSPTAHAYDAASTGAEREHSGQGTGAAGSAWSALTEASFSSVCRPPRLEPRSQRVQLPSGRTPLPRGRRPGFSTTTEFEFIELLNVSNDTLELSGCRFTNGVAFDFSSGSVLRLAPGAAGRCRPEPGCPDNAVPVARSKSRGIRRQSQLANSGERLRLEAADGSTIFDLAYGDSVAMARAADGDGFTLVLKRPESQPAPGPQQTGAPASSSRRHARCLPMARVTRPGRAPGLCDRRTSARRSRQRRRR